MVALCASALWTAKKDRAEMKETWGFEEVKEGREGWEGRKTDIIDNPGEQGT